MDAFIIHSSRGFRLLAKQVLALQGLLGSTPLCSAGNLEGFPPFPLRSSAI